MITSYYPIKIRLKAPTIIASIAGDPNSVVTGKFIPGSAIRGAIAADVMQNAGEMFDELILSGDVFYLNAYPIVAQKRALPTPISYREEKYNKKSMHDLAATNHHEWPNVQMTPSSYEFVTYTSAVKSGFNVDTGSQIHHQRDRKRGRPIGEEDGTGTVFVYQYIKEDQEFAGFIVIHAEDENEASVLIDAIRNATQDQILIGKSKRASYGGNAQLKWYKPKEREISRTGMNEVINEDIEPSNEFRIILLSDAIIRNQKTGQIDPSALIDEIETIVGGNAEVLRFHISHGIAGGHNRKWGMELPQSFTAVAGSVVVLRAKEAIPADHILRIEDRGIGERLNEGFGRIAFLRKATVNPSIDEFSEKKQLERPSTVPSLISEMERRIIEKALFTECDSVAFSMANVSVQKGTCLSSPSNSLVGRLRGLLRNESEEALRLLREWLDPDSEKCLREQARRQLETSYVFSAGKKLSIYNWLRSIARTENSQDAFDGLQLFSIRKILQRKHIVDESHAKDSIVNLLPKLRIRFIDKFLSNMVKLRAKSNGGAN